MIIDYTLLSRIFEWAIKLSERSYYFNWNFDINWEKLISIKKFIDQLRYLMIISALLSMHYGIGPEFWIVQK